MTRSTRRSRRRNRGGTRHTEAANTGDCDNPTEYGSSEDIIIVVMGPSGVGKSSFINKIIGVERMSVGHKLRSCTIEVEAARITPLLPPGLEDRHVIIVDTPGFDGTHECDIAILRRIAQWLESCHRNNAVLGGVIYLHDISEEKFSGTACKNLEIFNRLCGHAALSKVILGTTKWTRCADGSGESREGELKTVHWKSMIDNRSEVRKFEDTRESALQFIDDLLCKEADGTILRIQNELVNERKILPETAAGKFALENTRLQVSEKERKLARLAGNPEKKAYIQKQVGELRKDIKAMKIPISRRVLRRLGMV